MDPASIAMIVMAAQQLLGGRQQQPTPLPNRGAAQQQSQATATAFANTQAPPQQSGLQAALDKMSSGAQTAAALKNILTPSPMQVPRLPAQIPQQMPQSTAAQMLAQLMAMQGGGGPYGY